VEDAVAAIEVNERLALASLAPTGLGMLARRLGREQQVPPLDRDLLRAFEMLFGGAELARLPARSSRWVLLDLSPSASDSGDCPARDRAVAQHRRR
jgi:hypothetical protein